ncbi:MAG: hypothetical protein CFE44_00360 [Burkholderiales bacterium PBB4]|nr:MAG: hypothetical protein CFE44_00360 [Burkholderiales bacterium PBB4]
MTARFHIPAPWYPKMQTTQSTRRLQQFSSLVHEIYAASAEPALWPATVGSLAKAMGAVQAILFTPYVGPGGGGLFFPWQVEEKDLILYGTKYIEHDVWAQAAQRKGFLRDGVVAVDEELVPQEELLNSVYYREFLSTMGVGRICSGVVFEGAPGLPGTVLSVYRAPDQPFGSEEREMMGLLVPHLSRALGLMHRLNHARFQMESLRGALNRLSIGVFLLDHDLKLTFANATGDAVLARADGLQLDAQRRMTAPGFQQTQGLRLESWLAALVCLPAQARGSFSDTFDVARSDGLSTYSVQCCTLEPADPLAIGEGASHIVFVTDPRRVELPAPELLQKYLGLTPAEARVSRALVQGGSYREVATSMGVSEETIRTQVRSTYAKTRTDDKASLTRLVLSLSKAIV